MDEKIEITECDYLNSIISVIRLNIHDLNPPIKDKGSQQLKTKTQLCATYRNTTELKEQKSLKTKDGKIYNVEFK